ncbi:MAG: hypothetical protein AAGF12_30930 [Myxococcota bacterium]
MHRGEHKALVERALGGDRNAIQSLVNELAPMVHCRVARALYRRKGASSGRDLRQEIEDLTQEVFVALFAAEGKILRSWDPDRGLSLLNFAGLVAERRVATIFRSHKRSPWTEDPTESATLDSADGAVDPERTVADREFAKALLEELRRGLSPLGLEMFYLMFRDQKSVPEICLQMKMKPDAVYGWRSRLRKAVRTASLTIQEPRKKGSHG